MCSWWAAALPSFLTFYILLAFQPELSSMLSYRHWTSGLCYPAWHKARSADSSPSSPNNALYHFLWVLLRNCSILYFFFPNSAIHRCKVGWIKTHCKNCSQCYRSELLVFISFLTTLLSNNLCRHQYKTTTLKIKMVTKKSFSEYVCINSVQHLLLSFPKVKVVGIYSSSAQTSLQQCCKHFCSWQKLKVAAALVILLGTGQQVRSAPWSWVSEGHQ